MRIATKLLLMVCLVALLAGCKSGRVKEDPMMALSAEEALAEGKALMEAKKYRRAQEFLTHAFEIEPNSASGREGLLLAADALYLAGGSSNYIKAESKYRDFLNRFPTSDKAAYVQYQMANCLIERMRKPDRDQSISLQALTALQEVLQLYPDSEYAERAREQMVVVRQNLAEHEFIVGRFNLRFRLYPAAASRFSRVLEEYPRTEGQDRALFHLGLAHLKMKAWGKAYETFERLREEYPESEWIAKIPEARRLPEGAEAAAEEDDGGEAGTPSETPSEEEEAA